jgi:hypothetical protein
VADAFTLDQFCGWLHGDSLVDRVAQSTGRQGRGGSPRSGAGSIGGAAYGSRELYS